MAGTDPGREPSSVPQVRVATTSEIPTLATILARAFDRDPLVDWWARKDGRRGAVIEEMFAHALKRNVPLGSVYVTEDGTGVALWEAPNVPAPGLRGMLDAWRLFARVAGWRHFPAVWRSLRMLDAHHPHTPHYYLLAIGVLPGQQGRGIGTALMRPVLERCNREGVPGYLVCTTSRNIPLYERNGFHVTETLQMPKDGPLQWLMWRDPSALDGVGC